MCKFTASLNGWIHVTGSHLDTDTLINVLITVIPHGTAQEEGFIYYRLSTPEKRIIIYSLPLFPLCLYWGPVLLVGEVSIIISAHQYTYYHCYYYNDYYKHATIYIYCHNYLYPLLSNAILFLTAGRLS